MRFCQKIKNTFSFAKDKKILEVINTKDFKNLQHQLIKKLSAPNTPLYSIGDEKEIVREIKIKTELYNKDNITRTKAYLDFYDQHPEVHWSLLAHFVSRNGGWSMTDLKGSTIGNFLTIKEAETFFEFLEKANAYIFHDAYPQLLLYKMSKKLNRNLFHLLPLFSVSKFMEPIWHYFLQSNNSQLLTNGLIINEQQYIQQRLIENKYYQKNVLETVIFRAQDKLGLTEVFFPFITKRGNIELAGLTIHNFQQLHSRIEIGKQLYGVLFHNIYKQALMFAKKHPHTGSRKDFWPHIFTCTKTSSDKIYSPTLNDAWPDISHKYVDHKDWFTNSKITEELSQITIPNDYNLTHHYIDDLEKLMLITDIKELIS